MFFSLFLFLRRIKQVRILFEKFNVEIKDFRLLKKEMNILNIQTSFKSNITEHQYLFLTLTNL